MSAVYTGYMCECCWNSRPLYREDSYAGYVETMRKHEERGCACTKPTEQGARLRAGQWWDDERGCDVRHGVAEREAAALRGEVTP